MRHIRLNTLLNREDVTIERFHCSGVACAARHDEVAQKNEIVLPISGVFVKRDHNGQTIGDPSSVVFFNRSEPYRIDHPTCAPDSSFILTMSDTLLDGVCEACSGLVTDEGRFRRSGLQLGSQEWRILRTLVSNLLRRGRYDSLAVEENLVLMLATLSKCSAIGEGAEPRRLSNREKRNAALASDIKVWLNQKILETVRLSDIASDLNVSVFHMCRVFHSETGGTIHSYLTELRLRQAFELLATPGVPITHIAYDFGFSSHSHFTSRFHERFGQTPSEIREQLVL